MNLMSFKIKKNHFGAFGVLLFGLTLAAPPNEINNLSVIPGDSYVDLEWDDPTDSDGGFVMNHRIYYGTQSVSNEAADEYDTDTETSSSASSFRLTELTNGVQYYFAVTAIDDDGEESEFYSNEVSATPGVGANTNGSVEETGNTELDSNRMQVDGAEQVTNNSVKVDMSRDIDPNVDPSAFLIQDVTSGGFIDPTGGVVQGKSIVLTVEFDFVEGNIYEITASSAVRDIDGNPVNSGFTDTAEFTGVVFFQSPDPVQAPIPEPAPELEPEPDPVIEEPVVEVPSDPVDDPFENSGVFDSEITEPDPFAGLLVDENNDNELDTLFNSENDSGSGLFDDFNSSAVGSEPISEEVNPFEAMIESSKEETIDAEGVEIILDDTAESTESMLPKEVSNIRVDKSEVETKNSVTISWSPSVSIDQVAEQLVYVREGFDEWSDPVSLSADANRTSIAVKPNMNYQVRISVKNKAGTESFGESFSFSSSLSQSGPGMIIGVVAALIGGFFFLSGRRRA